MLAFEPVLVVLSTTTILTSGTAGEQQERQYGYEYPFHTTIYGAGVKLQSPREEASCYSVYKLLHTYIDSSRTEQQPHNEKYQEDHAYHLAGYSPHWYPEHSADQAEQYERYPDSHSESFKYRLQNHAGCMAQVLP